MDKQIQDFVLKCVDCTMFTDKKISEPIKHHQVPEKCWQNVAVDLFGPMPSSKHVVVVHDLSSRFPVATLVSSTKADKVIPVLSNIYDTYGNPEKQISDNGPPFNSTQMISFAQSRDIMLQKIPPRHPNSNPAETFMKPLGKAMKIANQHQQSEQGVLRDLLNSYRQTPHPSTKVAPADMLFRDGIRTNFPRRNISDKNIEEAKLLDLQKKRFNQDKINASKYKKISNFKVGDEVLVRNYNRRSKYDPLFESKPYNSI